MTVVESLTTRVQKPVVLIRILEKFGTLDKLTDLFFGKCISTGGNKKKTTAQKNGN